VREAALSFKDFKAADKDGLINEVLKVLPNKLVACGGIHQDAPW
jgi:hypothetical protein